jgi:hypothetical protein
MAEDNPKTWKEWQNLIKTKAQEKTQQWLNGPMRTALLPQGVKVSSPNKGGIAGMQMPFGIASYVGPYPFSSLEQYYASGLFVKYYLKLPKEHQAPEPLTKNELEVLSIRRAKEIFPDEL